MDKKQPEDALFKTILAHYQRQPKSQLALPSERSAIIVLYDQLRVEIVSLMRHSQIPEAELRVSLAWKIAEQSEHPDDVAFAEWCSALYEMNKDVTKAFAHYERAKNYFHHTGQVEFEGHVLIGCASCLSWRGRVDDAEQALLRARECLASKPDYRDWPSLYVTLSQIKIHQAEYAQAKAYTEKAERLAIALAHQNPEQAKHQMFRRVQALINRGFASLAQSEREEAHHCFMSALEMAQNLKAGELTGRVQLNLGHLYTLQDDLLAALEVLYGANQNFAAAEMAISQACVAYYQADIYARLTMTVKAYLAAMKAAQLFAKAEIVSESVRASLVATGIARQHLRTKYVKRAIQASASLIDQATPADQALWHVYQCYLTHGSSGAAGGLTETVAAIDQHYITLCELQAWEYAIKAGLIAAKLAAKRNPSQAIERYQHLIEQSKTYKLPNLMQQALTELAAHQPSASAKQTLRQAADIFVGLRRKMPVEVLKATLLSGHIHLYTRLIETELDSNGDAVQTLLEAKGALWTDLAAPVDFEQPDPEWVAARVALSQWQEELFAASDPTYQAICERKLAEAAHHFSEVDHLQIRSRESLPLPTLDHIQAQLSTDQVILDYFVGSQDIWVCITTVQESGQWVNLGPYKPIKESMRNLNLLLEKLVPQSDDAPESKRLAEAIATQGIIEPFLSDLYDRLIRPVHGIIDGAQSLLIAPDQFLFVLPWTALYDGEKYLSEAHLVHIIPTPVLLAQNDHSGRENRVFDIYKNVLILGNPGHPPLAHLDAELNSIQQLFPHAQVINPASSQDFQWEIPPTLLHISTHGEIDSSSPLLFKLQLDDQDYILADVFNLNLHGTSLVTLSACNSGTAPEQGGVLLALAGAFLCAGAQTVLSSLWAVDDRATQLLMAEFYRHLLAQKSVAQALQLAQSVVRQAGYSHPFYWAAFQPLGKNFS